jgi:methyl-accepting chemotaxis protein
VKTGKSLKNVETLVELSSVMSRLVHETQKERGASAGYLGSKGKKFVDTLSNQKTLTNKRVNEFNSFIKTINYDKYSSTLKDSIDNISNQLQDLENIRNGVVNLTLPVGKVLTYYTSLNAKILDIVPLSAKISNNTELSKMLLAYSNFLYSKERAGIERAVLSNTFANKGFGKGMQAKAITLISAQDSFMKSFLVIADDEVKEFYKNKMESPYVTKVLELRKKAFSGDFGVDSEYWFTTITKKINILKEIDDFISKKTMQKIKLLEDENSSDTILETLLVVVISLIIGFFVFIVNRSITNEVSIIYNEVEKIGKNYDINNNIDFIGSLELTQISTSINTLLESLRRVLADSKSISIQTDKTSQSLKKTADELIKDIEKQDNCTSLYNDTTGGCLR